MQSGKSGKKFAPKAVQRRRPDSSTPVSTQTSSRPSIEPQAVPITLVHTVEKASKSAAPSRGAESFNDPSTSAALPTPPSSIPRTDGTSSSEVNLQTGNPSVSRPTSPISSRDSRKIAEVHSNQETPPTRLLAPPINKPSSSTFPEKRSTRSATHVQDEIEAGHPNKRRRVSDNVEACSVVGDNNHTTGSSSATNSASTVNIIPSVEPTAPVQSAPKTSTLAATGSRKDTQRNGASGSTQKKGKAKERLVTSARASNSDRGGRLSRGGRGSRGRRKVAPGTNSFRVDPQPAVNERNFRGSDVSSDEEAQTTTHLKGKRRGRRRQATPENAERVEIVPSIVKMADLCKDLRTGKKSKRALELEAMDWTEIVRKQREQRAQRERGEIPQRETVDQMLDRVGQQAAAAPLSQAGPRMRLVNGKLVLDDSSLMIDRHAEAAAGQTGEAFEEVEENELTRRINSGNWLKREKTEAWDEEATELFYQGLRMFGTDFEIISKMFPTRSRRQVKLKFTKEERQNPDIIQATLIRPRTDMNLQEYSRLTQKEYQDPALIEAQLEEARVAHEEQKKRVDEEKAEEARKRREENERTPAREGEAGEEGGEEGAQAPPTETRDGGNRNPADAPSDATNLTATAGKGGKRGRKPSTKKGKTKLSKRPAGEAEVVGSVSQSRETAAAAALAA